ncbi:MAG: hypothetical protein AB7W28_01670 [Armatimonadota bacterium]
MAESETKDRDRDVNRSIRRIIMTVLSNCLALGAAAVLIAAMPRYHRGDVFDALMMTQLAIFLMVVAVWFKPH